MSSFLFHLPHKKTGKWEKRDRVPETLRKALMTIHFYGLNIFLSNRLSLHFDSQNKKKWKESVCFFRCCVIRDISEILFLTFFRLQYFAIRFYRFVRISAQLDCDFKVEPLGSWDCVISLLLIPWKRPPKCKQDSSSLSFSLSPSLSFSLSLSLSLSLSDMMLLREKGFCRYCVIFAFDICLG